MLPGLVGTGFFGSAAAAAASTDSALVNRSGTSFTATTTLSDITWNGEVYDRGPGWHDTSSNTARLTTLAGVSLARVVMQPDCGASSATMTGEMQKNGAAFDGLGSIKLLGNGGGSAALNATSAIVPVTGGTDYFTSRAATSSGTSGVGPVTYSWDFIEKIDSTTNYCLLKLTGNKATNNGTVTVLTWDSASGTQTGWYSAGNPSRITPTATLVRVTANMVENGSASTATRFRVLKNGSVVRGGASRHTNVTGADWLNLASAPISMNGTTDYLEVEVLTTGASSILADPGTWFQVEEVSAPHRVLAYNSGLQPLAANATNKIYLDTTDVDPDSCLQTSSSSVTITIASPGVVSWTAHGLANGTPIKLSTTGALPTGLTAGTVYYVVSAATNSFSLALFTGGAAINTSGSQSGTHTATTKTRLKSPAGVTQARVTYNLSMSATTGSPDFGNTGTSGTVTMNGAGFNGEPKLNICGASGVRTVGAVGAWVDLPAPGTDYFEISAHPGGVNRNVVADVHSWLCVEFR